MFVRDIFSCMRKCCVEGCERIHDSKGYCKKHYDALPESQERAKLREKQPHILANRKAARETAERKAYAKNWQLQKDFGITLETFNKMLSEQNNLCAICKKELVKPHVDHNHETNVVRGLLCKSCNQGIGFLKEDIVILSNAIEYLGRNK